MCSKFTKRDLRCRIQSLPHTFFESARSLQKVVPVSGNLCASNGCCRALHSPKARLLPHENRSDATTKRKISQNLEKSAQALVRTVNAISYNSAQILSFCTLLRPKCARAEVLCFPGESQIPQATEKIRETDLSGMLRAKAQLTFIIHFFIDDSLAPTPQTSGHRSVATTLPASDGGCHLTLAGCCRKARCHRDGTWPNAAPPGRKRERIYPMGPMVLQGGGIVKAQAR